MSDYKTKRELFDKLNYVDLAGEFDFKKAYSNPRIIRLYHRVCDHLTQLKALMLEEMQGQKHMTETI